MSDKKTQDMNVEELDELLLRGNAELDQKRDALRGVRKLRDQKAAHASLDKKLADMSPAEREILASKAQGISSAGAVVSAEKVQGLAK